MKVEVSLPYVDVAPSKYLMSEALYLIAEEAATTSAPSVDARHAGVPFTLGKSELASSEASRTEIHLAHLALSEAIAKTGGEATLLDELQRSLDGQLRAARLANYWLEKEIQLTNALRKKNQMDAATCIAKLENEDAALKSISLKIESELSLRRRSEVFFVRHFGAQ
ncbi:Hypothetical protein, putative [Bodo saltans]|uniref:Uncharacterized protein n=1 Tax=Bodo saltans TaxID=75058 RepID=A0A0S4KPE7_BODSA|nr:Hypothetical protein, putative [Bodo saltans]|eukprot:CUI15509.1 Hypothetical protein, putative [Bodo saltans]